MLFKKGYTLIELMVAVSVFTIIVGTAVGGFVSAINFQKKYLAQRELLDQTSYALEYVSRALRMAQKDVSGTCLGLANVNRTYVDPAGDGTAIKFLSYNNICTTLQYDSAAKKFKEIKIGFTPSESPLLLSERILINLVRFKIDDQGADNKQPKVMLFWDLKTALGNKLKVQTTISPRNLDI